MYTDRTLHSAPHGSSNLMSGVGPRQSATLFDPQIGIVTKFGRSVYGSQALIILLHLYCERL